MDKHRREGYESGVRAPMPASGRSEGTANAARRLGSRSVVAASVVLGALAAAQGCGGSEFCSENSYECGDPSGGRAGGAGTAGSSGAGTSGKGGKGGSASGGTSSGGASAGRAGAGSGGVAGDGGESGTGAGSGGEAGTGVTPPPTCDPAALVPGCVPADDGIFVATNGDDDNDGTATAPLGTIGAAVTRAASTGAPIFVCGGTFDEHVVVSNDRIEIHGGFACPTGGAAWIYDSTQRARIAPTTTGYALRVTTVSGLTVTDLELQSADAEMPGESSIAVFVSRSDNVAFTRVGMTAGNGVKGVDGVREGTNHTEEDLAGANASGNEGAELSVCTCIDETMSVGGQGGDGGLSPTSGGPGTPDEGAGMGGTVSACATGTNGGNGGNAMPSADGEGAMTLGALTTSGWSAANGDPGLNGTPGQGGGGGGGAATGGGGGGACGGCGGKGGGAGSGGGASIGLASVRSVIALTSVSLATGDAGDGGAGIEGEVGQGGGVGGNRTGIACLGGNGGTGADGAAGGGGAGGISVGILSTADSTVTLSDMDYDIGMPGAAGPAAMGSTNAGMPGMNGNTLEAS